MAVLQNLLVTQESQSIDGNYSKVRIKWTSTQTGDSHNYDSRTAYYYISINGGAEKTYSVKYTLPSKTTKTILDTTITVSHRADGTGSIKVRTWMDTKISAGKMSQSKTLTLKEIPRAAIISSAKDITLGETCEIKWTPKLASHRFRVRFASTDADIWKVGTYDTWYGRGSDDKISFIDCNKDSSANSLISPNSTQTQVYTGFKLPIEEIAKTWMPNSATRAVRVYLATYDSSGKLIGSPTSKDFKVTVPSSVIPTLVNMSATIDNSEVSDMTTRSKINALGLCLVGYSKIKLNASATGIYNSTINNYKISGGTYSYTFNGSSMSWTGSVIESSGSKTFSVQAVDSRGRGSTTKSSSIEAYNYYAPQINSFTVARDDKNQTKVQISAKWSYTSLSNKNTATVTVYCKTRNSTSWSAIGTVGDGSKSSEGDVFTVIGYLIPNMEFQDTAEYDFKIKIEDKIEIVESSSISISTRRVLLDFRAGGKGLGVGKICQTDSMEVALPLSIEGGIKPIYLNDQTNLFSKTTPGFYVGSNISSMKDFRTYNGTTHEIKKSPTKYYGENGFLLEVLPLDWDNSSGTVTHVLQRLTVFIANRKAKYYRCIYGGAYANSESAFSEWRDDGDSRIDPRTITGVSANFSEEGNIFTPLATKISDNYTVIPIITELGFLKSDTARPENSNAFDIVEDRRISSSYFSVQSNGIKCLETGFVQVSANIRAVCTSSSSNGLILGGIFLKPTGQSESYLMGGLSSGVLQSSFVCLSIPVFTIKVNSGDILQLEAKKLNSSVPETTTLGGDCTMTVSYL